MIAVECGRKIESPGQDHYTVANAEIAVDDRDA